MKIQAEETPDKNVMNFFSDVNILEKGEFFFKEGDNFKKFPLIEKLFEINGIKNIFIKLDLICVTKKDDASWDILKSKIIAGVMEHISLGEPSVFEDDNLADNDSLENKIQTLINARIRPAVQQDGGDVVYKGYENGIVYVSMVGSCSSCPYAMITLKEGIEKVIINYFPEVKAVESI
ncbi:MAG: NifU family protein [Alphaproteobacteria bacterium]